MANYKVYCWNSIEYSIEKTFDAVGEYNSYTVFKTFAEAKKYLINCLTVAKDEWQTALKITRKTKKSQII